MGTLALGADERVAAVEVSEDTLSVSLVDGRTILVPLAWYPRLMNATPEQRQHWQIAGGGFGLHWPEIDEDLSTEGLLRGAPALRVVRCARRNATTGRTDSTTLASSPLGPLSRTAPRAFSSRTSSPSQSQVRCC